MTTLRNEALSILRQAEGNPDATFRAGQWEAIEALVAHGSRLLVVQKTGWGKSMVYFVATVLLCRQNNGLAIIISPLIALMTNQLAAARRVGLNAVTINSSNEEDWDRARIELMSGRAHLLIVSPEKLFSQDFRANILSFVIDKIRLFVVDEAHCISDWGHDFRPLYRRIASLLQSLPPGTPVLATTATANARVVADVELQLGPNLTTLRGPLVRESLWLQNISMPSPAARMAWLAHNLGSLPGSGIIYCLTVRDAKRLSAWLQTVGIRAPVYTGKMDAEERATVESALLTNQVKAIVATQALGMGFDKPDLGFVVHFQRPASVVHYYQQVGRAGRKMENAVGVLFSGDEDDEIADYFIHAAIPPSAHMHQVLDELANSPASIPDLQSQLNLSKTAIEKVLRLAEASTPQLVVKSGTRYVRTQNPYVPNEAQVRELIALRMYEQQKMKEYMVTAGCLMQYLAGELGDVTSLLCGRCANCVGKSIVNLTVEVPLVHAALAFIQRSEIVISPRKQWQGGLTRHGRSRISESLRAEEGRALSAWADGGWGDLVKEGKQTSARFDDALVQAAADLISSRWKPNPTPTWVTVVPSLRTTTLVPDFAQRLAHLLGIQFRSCIVKIRHTEPQKLMQNSVQQEHNLDGAFQVDASQVGDGPVLLVDDIVDSGWTFTVLAAQLREAGIPAVHPFALASTAAGGGD